MSQKPSATVWRVRILSTTWLSYARFYFCRKNFAVAKSSLLTSLQIDRSDLAHLVSAYLMAYMLGQFLTAFTSRRFATRTLLLTGMGVTLLANIGMGFTTLMGPAGYWPLLLFNIVNGFAQSTGWPGNIGVLGNWLKRGDRGRVMAVWATCYQLGSIFAKSFAALMLAIASAAWSFWGASIIMLGVWVLFYLFQRDSPEDVGLDPIIEPIESTDSDAVTDDGKIPAHVMTSIIWMGSVYFVFKFLRYALDSWSPLAIEELFALSPAMAGTLSTMFDWVGFVGVLFAGWASDRFFGGRRTHVIVGMTVGMALAFVFLGTVGTSSVLVFGIGLSLCGFMLMGPDSLLSGVGAIDVGGRRTAVMAAGIINGLGSIGPVVQEELIGYLLDHHGYEAVFNALIIVSVIGIAGTSALAFRSRKGRSAL